MADDDSEKLDRKIQSPTNGIYSTTSQFPVKSHLKWKTEMKRDRKETSGCATRCTEKMQMPRMLQEEAIPKICL